MTINDYILEISKLVIVAYLAYGFGKYRGVFQAMEMIKNWSDDEAEEVKKDANVHESEKGAC